MHFIRLISQPLGSYYLAEDKCQGCAFDPSHFCYRSGPTPSLWHDSSSLHFMFFHCLHTAIVSSPKGLGFGNLGTMVIFNRRYFGPCLCSLWPLWGCVCMLPLPPLALLRMMWEAVHPADLSPEQAARALGRSVSWHRQNGQLPGAASLATAAPST